MLLWKKKKTKAESPGLWPGMVPHTCKLSSWRAEDWATYIARYFSKGEKKQRKENLGYNCKVDFFHDFYWLKRQFQCKYPNDHESWQCHFNTKWKGTLKNKAVLSLWVRWWDNVCHISRAGATFMCLVSWLVPALSVVVPLHLKFSA